jgi:hypothetical protein
MIKLEATKVQENFLDTLIPMKIETIEILSAHDTLKEAVEAASLDLSSPAPPWAHISARKSMARIDQDIERAFVCGDGTIRYIFKCDITLLNKFEPFFSIVSNSPFQLVTLKEDDMEIMISHQNWPKCKATRKYAAKLNLILTSD